MDESEHEGTQPPHAQANAADHAPPPPGPVRGAEPQGAHGPGAGDIEALGLCGDTVIYAAREGRLLAAIAMADIVRDESREAVRRLREMGLEIWMITGDNRLVAQHVAAELGLTDFFAEVLPEHKATKVRELQARGKVVAMVGDGVNDAPAITQANIGLAPAPTP